MSAPFGFGVYPFGLAGGPDGLAAGPPDDLGQIREMLCRLQGEGPELLARVYVGWSGPQSTQRALGQIADLIEVGLSWDLVLAYRDPSGNVAGWGQFVAQSVARFGRHVAAVQVTGEANLTDVPHAGDGAYPRATEAVVEGLSFAAEAKRAHGALAAVGFAVVPEDDPSAGRFWPALAARGGSRLAACVDYVGLDMYPDVFGSRVEQGQLDSTVDTMLRRFREDALPIAGVGAATPIRICENGWPTGPGRSECRQAEVLDTVLRAVHARRHDLNITHWELFALRDADSKQDSPFHQFGILRDDYTPKPAFERLRNTIAELRGFDPPTTLRREGVP